MQEVLTSLALFTLRIKPSRNGIYLLLRNKYYCSSSLIFRLLMFTCCYTPWTLAFSDTMDQTSSTVLETCTDALFCIDIILIFFTSFYDDEYCLIDDRKVSKLNKGNNFIEDCKVIYLWILCDWRASSTTFWSDYEYWPIQQTCKSRKNRKTLQIGEND